MHRRPAEEAIKDLILNDTLKGKIEDGRIVESPIHPTTLNRWLSNDELGRKSKLKRASLRLTTNHPLEVLQWDSTRATQWYVDKVKDDNCIIKYISPLSENKNRSNKKTKLVFMAFQDMFSRKVWFKVDTHESSQTWLEQFYEVTSQVGMPKYIYTDNASIFHRNGAVNKTLKELNIELLTHIPGNPQAKGMIERSIQFLEKRATITLVEKATTLKGYNDIVNTIANEYNSRTHSTTELAPDMLFYSHLQNQTVVMPPNYDDFMSISPKWDNRILMTNFTVKWNGKTYQAKTHKNILTNYTGKQVRVEENIKYHDKINLIIEGKEIDALNINIHGEDTISFGEFNQLPESKKTKLLKQLKEHKVSANYNERLNQTFTNYEENYEKPNIVAFNVKKDINHIKHDFESASIYLASSGIEMTKTMRSTLYNLFGDRTTVYESELDSIIRKKASSF
jgi:hypothetical protein